MFKIQKTIFTAKRGRHIVYNVRKFFSDKLAGKPTFENKPATSNKLPSVIKNEDIKPLSMPFVGIHRFRSPMSIPTMTNFFNKSFNDLAKELLLIEPVKNAEVGMASNKQPFNTSAEFTDKGMTIAIEMKGFKEEDINVRVEGPWLVVEGQSSVSVPEREGGGLHVRHVIRRYEVPPNSDVSAIKSSFRGETLTITVPTLTPKVTKEP